MSAANSSVKSRAVQATGHSFGQDLDLRVVERLGGSARRSARPVRHPAPLLVKLDVIGKVVTLSESEAEELRAAAGAEAGRSSARRDLSLLLDRGLRTLATVALNRAEARELAEFLASRGFRADLRLLQEALREALADGAERH